MKKGIMEDDPSRFVYSRGISGTIKRWFSNGAGIIYIYINEDKLQQQQNRIGGAGS